MRASNRIIVNTFAQYVRTIINILLSLYSSRLVLEILGVDDYGIYSLVAGVVTMLSFFTNSLVGSTQRFLSVSQGKGDIDNLKIVFGSSVLLHILLGFIVLLILEACTPFLFNGFLNIPEERIGAAINIYQLVILMVYISFIAAPYKALLISRENIVYTSIIDVIDGVLKVVLVIFLQYITFDKLVAYGYITLLISIFNLAAYVIYPSLKYEECILPRFRYFDLKYIKKLFSFTSWIIYAAASVALRNQGIAIVLNKFFGAAINAAYGIGGQISGMCSFLSSSFDNAVSPQLMASAGGNNRERMLYLAEIGSKFPFLLISMIGIPTLFEMQFLLELWLINVPEYTVYFGATFLLMQIVDQLSIGLATTNKAMGNIGVYIFVTVTPKLFILPLGWIVLEHGFSLKLLCLLMIFIEFICMLLRVFLLRKMPGFNAWKFCNNVMLKSLPPVVLSVVACYLISNYIDSNLRFICTYVISIIVFLSSSYMFALSKREKDIVDGIMLKFIKK